MSGVDIVGTVVAKGFTALCSELFKLAFSKRSKVSDGELSQAKFEAHLEATFERCTKIKTLISRDIPIDLLDHYVNIKLSTGDKDKNRSYEDYDVIDQIRKRRYATITGTAGGGKTVFMRYLWISFFVDPRGRIPIFLELRRINDLTSVDILSFIFREILTNDSKVDIRSFIQAIDEGKFIFIFDGFDEVSDENRSNVERQILELASKGRENIVIVSSRPDDRFNSWQSFANYKVQPLSKNQIVQLISKISFDHAVKQKFIAEIKKDLYEKHESFLSSPLLASMMLLTFQHYAEIPEKIHVFYDLAFDTLFSKHDALKEAFSRKKYTNLPIDIFKRKLSLLCLVTYNDQKIEFSKDDLLQYIDRISNIENTPVDSEAFCRDLLESVCILQQDGLSITFSHRSFQEFFSAYCLARMPIDKLKLLLPRLAERIRDSVMIMLFDMNKDLVEECYVVPMVKLARKKTKHLSNKSSAKEIVQTYGLDIGLMFHGGMIDSIVMRDGVDPVGIFKSWSYVLYRENYKKIMETSKKYSDKVKKQEKLFPNCLRNLINRELYSI